MAAPSRKRRSISWRTPLHRPASSRLRSFSGAFEPARPPRMKARRDARPGGALALSRVRPRVYRGLEELTYPFHDQTIMVTGCGRICFRGRKVNLSHGFGGQSVGVTQVGERVWLVTFMQYDLRSEEHTSELQSLRHLVCRLL